MNQDLTLILELVDNKKDYIWKNLFQGEPIFIENENVLVEIIKKMKNEPILGIDTENDRRWRYYENISLIQIATKENAYLIDTAKINNIKILNEIFSDKSIIKVFHDAKQDILDLKKQEITEINNIFDTFIATRLLGFGDHGYANLVKNIFEITLDKKQQKADWSKRPLTKEMLNYAKYDVVFLIDLYYILSSILKQNDLLTNANEYFDYILSINPEKQIFNPGSYKRIKGSTGLPLINQIVLYNLYNWREKVASDKNRAPYLIISNQTLLEISKILPKNEDELKEIKGIGKSLFKKYCNILLKEIQDSSIDNIPQFFGNQSTKRFITIGKSSHKLSNENKFIYNLRMKNLLKWRDEESRNLNINSDAVIPRIVLQKLSLTVPVNLNSKEDLPILPGFSSWRREKYGNEIFEILKQVNISQNCLHCNKKFLSNEIRAICPFCEGNFHIKCIKKINEKNEKIECPNCFNIISANSK